MSRINLEDEDGIIDVEITVLEMDAPLVDADYHLLRALYHLGKKFREDDGFWINPGDIANWLEANRFPMTPKGIGTRLQKMRFGIIKRLSQGNFRYIKRERLMELIDLYNAGKADTTPINYETIKLEVFACYLEGGEVDELDLDLELVKKATDEFVSMEKSDAQKWVDTYVEIGSESPQPQA